MYPFLAKGYYLLHHMDKVPYNALVFGFEDNNEFFFGEVDEKIVGMVCGIAMKRFNCMFLVRDTKLNFTK